MIYVTQIPDVIPPGVVAALQPALVRSILLNLAMSAQAKWISLAGKRYRTARRDYVAGIQAPKVSGQRAVVSLVGVLPNMLEQGVEAFRLHDVLLGPRVPEVGPGQKGKRKAADGGYYRSIPFRHATPGSIGFAGNPLGRAYQGHPEVDDAGEMGRKVYQAAQRLRPTKGQPYGPVEWGERLTSGHMKAAGADVPLLKRQHSVNIYEDMVRQEKTYERATQAQYMTWRRISVDAEGQPRPMGKWLHPGLAPANLVHEVAAHVAKIAPAAFQAYVRGATG